MAAKRKKKVTLKEFRAWLEGVEELQPKEWSPTAEQWKLIRAKIDSIVEETSKVVQHAPVKEEVRNSPPVAGQRPPAPPPGESNLPPGVPAFPEVPSNIPAEAANITVSPEAARLMNPASDGKTKTPEIDTSDGNFNSPFV